MVKNPPCNEGDPGSERSRGDGNGYPLQPGEFHGQKNLVGHKESDMTEQISTLTTPAKSLLSCNVTYLQVLGIRLWSTLGGNYAPHPLGLKGQRAGWVGGGTFTRMQQKL